MNLQKVVVAKEQYDLIKNIERIHSEKISNLDFMIPMEVQGTWGLYKVHYCYASFYNIYYAEIELKKESDGKYEALLLAIKHAT
ncbi:hypothetical protein [Lysinibacillus fusiformis]|uniref:hypothetical protein n=1 Tax=Lysinibacillus fusiformis TaxID=28031 RepID=UPI000506449D|nr:hypothetical protein [Lysinibacillus fusiformis]KGA83681.1 hypothetical protein KQ41_06470 [Lysinibacillus fusiformis]UXJ71365.1 hypothetical protein N5069_23360 [Lysinibacillus fusiformis]